MKLILAGTWLGKGGFFEGILKSMHFLSSIQDIKKFTPPFFLLVPYTLSTQTLELEIKNEGEKIILAELVGFKPYNPKKSSGVELKLKGAILSDEEYKERIKKIKKYIEKGDVYQINLTNRFEFELKGSSEELFFNFYEAQPVPFAFYLELEDFYVISGSMELFLEKKGNVIRSKPIKGTAKEEKTLLLSEKERAENLMITDMMRNDIGRIARTGSVEVEELFKVEKYRTLYHMHSTVKGITDKSLSEILSSTFPPASVTGAPKRRAVEIIDELEPFSRSYYCGSGGLVFSEEDFTLSVLIRTAIGRGDRLYYYAGCGIVWDSVEERETEEMHLKVEAFKRAGSLVFQR
ncbi:chorismate-binding protein [Aquifex aeolicus]|uniref:p-aminobenzoate synthetase n=1 Tax=Aquifex aeolicus (strain VF5) TaxID=224324 RepID=O67217_AQUAE|nr:anthranilate synthase component I family protein [Aquifex aeolicus]AAC07173.1 p-aminobenzoate synthetase [Aquifex aeolicus VF5]